MKWPSLFPEHLSIFCILQFLMVVLILIIVCHEHVSSSFSNPNDSQYNNRYVAADVPVAAQQSLNDRMVAAQNAAHIGKMSSMTGSRDPPIFWRGYDTDMNMVHGNVYNARENAVDTSSSFSNKKDCNIPGVTNC